jgi:hypothetical protein
MRQADQVEHLLHAFACALARQVAMPKATLSATLRCGNSA